MCATGGPYRVYCLMNNTMAVSLGGDGATPQTASTSCNSIKTYFGNTTNITTGVFYLVTNIVNGSNSVAAAATAENTTLTTRTLCQMTSSPAVSLGNDGSTSALAAYTCLSVYRYFNVSASGVRWINPANPFQAYCDMSDGGGWMKILHLTPIIASYYTTSTGSFGNISLNTTTVNAKMADSNINHPTTEAKVFKYVSSLAAPNFAYVRPQGGAQYTDTSVGTGLFASYYGCMTRSMSTCAWRGPAALGHLDTSNEDDQTFSGNFTVGNDKNRIFSDYGNSVNCHGVCISNCRCYSTGCCALGHSPIAPFIIYVRTYP